MTDETTTPVWPPTSAAPAVPYTPAPATQNNDDDNEETTGVENVRYDSVTKTGAPANPTTPEQAQHQALSLVPAQYDDGERYSASNYAELIEQLQQRMSEIRPLTKEEIEKKKRQQRTEGIISGISDAAQAISNLVFTTQYAPDMYNPKEGMSAKAQERFDKARAQRDADDNRYMNYALQLGRARDAVDALRGKERQQNIALQLKVNEDARRQAKAEYDAEMADIDLQIRMEKLGYEGARARKEAAEARLAAAYAEHADEKVISEINRNNRANRGGSRGGNGSNYRIRRRKPDGSYEIRDGFRNAGEAKNYVGTHSDEGWEFVTTPVRTEHIDVYGDKTVTVKDESSAPTTSGTDGNNSNEHFNIGW